MMHLLRRGPGAAARAAVATTTRRFSLAAPGQPPYRVLFFGTDDVSLETLKTLHANSQEQGEDRVVEHLEVVCPSDRPMSRGKRQEAVPVKKFAQQHELRVFHTPAELKSLKKWDFPVTDSFDVGVVVSFGYFLHPHMLANLQHRAINLHPSLLPKYRGPAPIHHALLNGDHTTGVSVIEIDPRAFDVGRILSQEKFAIPPGIQCQELSKELGAFGASCVLDTLRDLPGRKETAVVQDDALASKAPKLTPHDGVLSFNESAADIFHRWQALSSSVGVSVRFRDKVVKLIEVRLPSAEELQSVEADEVRNGPCDAGTFFYEKKRKAIWLRCADDSWLLVLKLQQADRKVGAAIDFANGLRLKTMQRDRFDEIAASTH